jgi:hypothetical protein
MVLHSYSAKIKGKSGNRCIDHIFLLQSQEVDVYFRAKWVKNGPNSQGFLHIHILASPEA